MQLALVDPGRQVGPRTATERALAVGVASGASVSTTSVSVSATAAATDATDSPVAGSNRAPAVRGGLRHVDVGLNQRIAGAQQGLQFLNRAASQLSRLKSSLLAGLAASPSQAPSAEARSELSGRIERFSALWRERASISGGSLDAQLDAVVGEPRQRFSVSGLSMSSLRSGERETLYVAVGNRTPRAAAVAIEPGLTDAEIVRRLDRALAPNGIRVTPGKAAHGADGGELSFSVPESSWASIRDGLMIKGEGRRFPTGQFSAVRTLADAPAMQPQSWTVQDAAAMHETLRNVMNAQARVDQAHSALSQSLIEEGRQLQLPFSQADAGRQEEGRWSAAFASSFAATASRADYEALAALSPALLGMHRDRVLAVLGADAGMR